MKSSQKRNTSCFSLSKLLGLIGLTSSLETPAGNNCLDLRREPKEGRRLVGEGGGFLQTLCQDVCPTVSSLCRHCPKSSVLMTILVNLAVEDTSLFSQSFSLGASELSLNK